MGIKAPCLRLFVATTSLLILCEFLVYYVVLLQCHWPQGFPKTAVYAMILADTHLLGPYRGHWFDQLRREWQMHRAFQTAMTIHSPEVVFVLGDLFDEGLWTDTAEFEAYVSRFRRLFEIPENSQIHVAVGNHDIGFHYGMTAYLHERFSVAFDAPEVKLVTIKGSHFVLLNSMAMEGDGCYLCRGAEKKIMQIGAALQCAKLGRNETCAGNPYKIRDYSRPVLLQHFPMYRESDAICDEPDEAPGNEKHVPFRQKWDCLSQESSKFITDVLKPRLIVTGHTHHGCRLGRPDGSQEWTLPSFNWRNKDNPSFALAAITPDDFAIEKCYMPRESTVICLYVVGTFAIVLFMVVTRRSVIFRLRGIFQGPSRSPEKGS